MKGAVKNRVSLIAIIFLFSLLFFSSLANAAITYNAGSNLITLTGSGSSPTGGTSWANAYDMEDILTACGAVVTKQGDNAYDVSARLLFQTGVYFVSESEFVELKPNPAACVYTIDADAGSHIRIGNYDPTYDYCYNGAFWRMYFASCTGSRLNRFDGELLIYGSNWWHDSTSYTDSWNFWGTTRIYDSEMEGTAYISGSDTNCQRMTWYGKGAASYDILLASGYDFAWAGIKVMNSPKGLFMSSTTTSDIDIYDVTLVDNNPYDYYGSGNYLMRFINSNFDRNKVYVPSSRQGLQECYTFNVKVTDGTNPIIGATVELKDVDGTLVFSEQTIAGGVLSNDQIVKAWWKGYDYAGGIKDYNDHTLKVTSGSDVTEYKITVDHKINEDIVLLPQATASYDEIMAALTTTTDDFSLLALLTVIPILWTILIFVFFRIVELKGLAFLAAIISCLAWVSVGVTAVEIDVPYNLGIVFLYVLCSIPSFILMIYFIPESWKTSKQEV